VVNRFRSYMTSLVLGDLILESLTPSVSAPLGLLLPLNPLILMLNGLFSMGADSVDIIGGPC
jgi:hypothetical protein